ncbi:hypothetical protein AB0C93_11135 [Streptomyces sp. NPDC048518]|uniref:hypothetical protein n=1 Tax=Streptomyces sp. NPDC048518 TaxID=3155029 RepID=UPI00340D62AA
MMQPAPALRPWTVLISLAVACLLGATLGARTPLGVAAAALGTAAIAAYGSAQVRSGRPCAAPAWLGAGCIAAVLSWALDQEDYLLGYPVAVVQLLVGLALLPSHQRRSARSPAAGERDSP